MIYTILNNNNITDNYKFIVTKYFYRYHTLIGLENNLLLINNLQNQSPLTFNLISDIYYIVSKQLTIIPHIQRFYKAYKNNKFWKLNIEEMIIYLKNLICKKFILENNDQETSSRKSSLFLKDVQLNQNLKCIKINLKDHLNVDRKPSF
jgi:hypothetical protein